MTTRPSRLMTSRPSRLTSHDFTALAPHGFTAHTLHDRTTLAPHDPRPSRRYLESGHSTLTSTRPTAPYANCGRARSGHQSRRHTGYVTAPGRDCRGCLRSTPTDWAGTTWSAPSPARASTSRSAPSQAPRGTQRDEPAQVGRVPPQTTPLLSVWGCKWGSNPLSSTTSAHSTCKRERTQVRLAARVVHPGGFGTCVPGAWTG